MSYHYLVFKAINQLRKYNQCKLKERYISCQIQLI